MSDVTMKAEVLGEVYQGLGKMWEELWQLEKKVAGVEPEGWWRQKERLLYGLERTRREVEEIRFEVQRIKKSSEQSLSGSKGSTG
jgi:hypothetical protein